MPSFLVNYGGPVCSLTSMNSQYDNILKECKKFYGGTPEAIGFTIKGIDVTYYKIGIHRMIKVELPDSVEEDLKSSDKNIRQKAKEMQLLYVKVKAKAGDFNTTGYKLLGNNCVSAVANVLNSLDASILNDEKKIVPQLLDKKVEACTRMQVMAHEVLNPPSNVKNDKANAKDVIPTKKYYSGGVPLGLWQAMSSPSKNAKNKNNVSANANKSDSANNAVDAEHNDEIKIKP